MKTVTESKASIVDSVISGSASKRDAECRLAEMAIGVVAALRHAQISIDDSYWDLFNVDGYGALQRHRMSRELKALFSWGMELADVEELTPEGLSESYDAIENLAEQILKRRGTAKLPSRMRRLQAAGE